MVTAFCCRLILYFVLTLGLALRIMTARNIFQHCPTDGKCENDEQFEECVQLADPHENQLSLLTLVMASIPAFIVCAQASPRPRQLEDGQHEHYAKE